jgi:hypothetical protein
MSNERYIGRFEAFDEITKTLLDILDAEEEISLTPEDLADRVGLFLAWLSGRLNETKEDMKNETNNNNGHDEGDWWKNE